ncbi:MAG TPA: amidase family protein, partial [Acidimicrobiales bacterium]
RLRIALAVDAPNGEAVHADCVAAARAVADRCVELGHEVVEDAPSVDADHFTGQFISAWAAGNAWTILDWEERIGRSATREDVEPLTWALVEMGRATTADQYLMARQELQKASRLVGDFMERYDVILTPTLGEPPVPLGTFDSPPDNPLHGIFRAASFVPFTPLFNVTGQPAISLPLHWNDEGLPIGVQFAGRLGDEETLLSLAGQFEQALPWADRLPSIHA